MKKTVLLLSFLFFQVNIAYSQEDALVFFEDKENVEAALANPISILTQKAIDRKLLHNTPIDSRDVPVNEAYITAIKNIFGIYIFRPFIRDEFFKFFKLFIKTFNVKFFK